MAAITFLNQKGGVGKTSSVFHLSGALARSGRRVLVVDTDPQGSLTQGFFGPEGMRALRTEQTVAALFVPGAEPLPEALIRPTGVDGVAIVPGSAHLYRVNRLPDEVDPETWQGLRSFLGAVRGEYDLILIDCPPNLQLCSWAALVASDAIVVPLQAEDFGSQGLIPVQDAIAAVREGPNPRLRLAGFLLTMFDRRLAVHLAYETMLRRLYGPAVFAASVPRAKDFVEAVANRRPIAALKPRCAAAQALEGVMNELLERVGLAEAATTSGAERGAA